MPARAPTVHKMRVDLFDFEFPEELIALRPARPRDSARLLHAPIGGGFEDLIVRDAPRLFREGDLLVFNDTRVIPARLKGVRERDENRVPVEATLHKRLSPSRWAAFMKPGTKPQVFCMSAIGSTFARGSAAAGCCGSCAFVGFICAEALSDNTTAHTSTVFMGGDLAVRVRRRAMPNGPARGRTPNAPGSRCGNRNRVTLRERGASARR